MTEDTDFDLPPLENCKLRTFNLQIQDKEIAQARGDVFEYVLDRLKIQSFRTHLPYTQARTDDGIGWQFRQQFVVFPNGDEYICVRKGTEKE